MAQKELLLIDLSARLTYGVKVTWDGKHPLTVTPYICCAILSVKNLPKLLLRPMSSMTEEEAEELKQVALVDNEGVPGDIPAYIDWLNSHHFDYRGLIEKGLALQAPEGMYKLK